ncbi:MAG: beta-propeller domain-containing protein [Deltaproteobacteria bacterium]|nr:beta-propeller domain-containing protein [Deltaproteobacteria bacterium]
MRYVAPLLVGALFACDPGMETPEIDVGRMNDSNPGATDEVPPSVLQRFHSCAEVEDHLTAVVVESLVQSRYAYWYWGPMAEDNFDADGAAGADEGPTDYTTTNTQEVGVDEVDLIETDGWYIYATQNNELYILDSWPADETNLLATVPLEGYPRGMFLYDDTVVVFSYVYSSEDFEFRGWAGTRITVVDVSDRIHPKVVREIDFEGRYVDARRIENDVYLVVHSYMPLPYDLWNLLWSQDLDLPETSYDDTEEERDKARRDARIILEPHVREAVRSAGTDAFLPMVRDHEIGTPITEPQVLHECEDLYEPPELSHHSVLSLIRLDLDSGDLASLGLVADGWQVYASGDSLYVAQASWWWWWGWGDLDMKTDIHKFDLRGHEPVYAGSGEVEGWMLDQFSMSEYDGYLRVASTEVDWWWGTGEDEGGSRVTVLEPVGPELREVGLVEGIAPGERITAVRMIGERGFVVTFEQIDPLFTVDLSNPYHPRVMGELELPGFSTYLHPLGEDHLLAVGRSGDENGATNGMAVSVFDVSDMTDPKLAQQYVLVDDGWTWSEALWDHHAFTYHRGVLSVPIYTSSWDNGTWSRFSGLLVLDASEHGIMELGRVDHSDLVAQSECLYGYNCETYWYASIRRSVYIEDNVYSLSNYGLKVNDLYDPEEEIAQVLFRPAL